MQSDFEMIVREFPKDDIRIYPIYDVHLGAAEHLDKEWNEFLKTILNDPNAYVIIGGDLVSNGVKNSVTDIYAETMRPDGGDAYAYPRPHNRRLRGESRTPQRTRCR